MFSELQLIIDSRVERQRRVCSYLTCAGITGERAAVIQSVFRATYLPLTP